MYPGAMHLLRTPSARGEPLGVEEGRCDVENEFFHSDVSLPSAGRTRKSVAKIPTFARYVIRTFATLQNQELRDTLSR